MVDVPVVKAFAHDGRTYEAGETASLSPVEALVLARQGKVSLSRAYQHRDLTARSKRGGRQTYKRRDMVAGPVD